MNMQKQATDGVDVMLLTTVKDTRVSLQPCFTFPTFVLSPSYHLTV